MGDRPFAGLSVKLTKPDGSEAIAVSNLAGFANWNMSAGNVDEPIYMPGIHASEPLVPDGWIQTTASISEEVVFSLMPEAPAGLVADATFSFVGVAPYLTLTIPRNLSRQNASVDVHNGDRLVEGAAGQHGDYIFDLSGARTATVTARPLQGKPVVRRIEVGNYPLHVSESLFDPSLSAPDNAPVVVDFEGLATPNMLRETPSGYGGFNWSNLVTTHERTYGLRGHLNNTVSGEFMAYTSSGYPASVWLDTTFDFLGGYFAVSHAEAEKGMAVVEGWRDGEIVHSEALRLRHMTPVHFLANWNGIDKLVIRHEHYWQVVVDDLALRKH